MPKRIGSSPWGWARATAGPTSRRERPRVEIIETIKRALRIVRPPYPASSGADGSGSDVRVPGLLELHEPHHTALRENQGFLGQLVVRGGVVLHRVAARPERHALHIHDIELLLQR